jgi:hypothetical protein
LEKNVEVLECLLSDNKRRRRKRRGMSSSTDNNGSGGGGGGGAGGSRSSRVTAHLVLVEGGDELPKSIPLNENTVRKRVIIVEFLRLCFWTKGSSNRLFGIVFLLFACRW